MRQKGITFNGLFSNQAKQLLGYIREENEKDIESYVLLIHSSVMKIVPDF